ncbi:MAG: hypothetical protein INQ03_21245 [Candidatus Heimdallarchaeota archaeon]|nr:hypothetical protein [Candidatus Heimdallarchaeota archaeon]
MKEWIVQTDRIIHILMLVTLLIPNSLIYRGKAVSISLLFIRVTNGQYSTIDYLPVINIIILGLLILMIAGERNERKSIGGVILGLFLLIYYPFIIENMMRVNDLIQWYYSFDIKMFEMVWKFYSIFGYLGIGTSNLIWIRLNEKRIGASED